MRKIFNYFILLLSNILILSFLSIWNIANAGNVVVYTASGPEIFEPIANGFKSNNPDIDLSFTFLKIESTRYRVLSLVCSLNSDLSLFWSFKFLILFSIVFLVTLFGLCILELVKSDMKLNFCLP